MRRGLRILIVLMCALLFVSLSILLFVQSEHDRFERNVFIQAGGTTAKTLSFEKLDLKPGESVEYTINIKCLVDGDYDISFDFNQTENGNIGKFVVVDVTYKEQVKSEKLNNLFMGLNRIEIDGVKLSEKAQKILIKYTMPYEVDNEAKNTWSKFNVVLTATHK